MSLSLESLKSSIDAHAAIRRRTRLVPVGGPGDKVFPPTYPGEGRNPTPQHVFEQRRVDGETLWCVLLDSVQSQANRLEEALLESARRDAIALPRVVVDFRGAGFGDLTEITSLDAPHRVFDAILRDSLLGDAPFMASDLGKRLQLATIRDATSIFEASPSALVFGAWNSTGEGGGVGAKFPRIVTSEIIGINVPVEPRIVNERTGETAVQTAGRRTGIRIDPLGILRGVPVFKSKSGWDTEKSAAGKGAKPARPSEINHGNIATSVQPLGVTFDYAEQVAVVSLAGLRRLAFGADERSAAARAMLAALAVLALVEQERQGYALRSRCELVAEGPSVFELVRADGTCEPLSFSLDDARQLYADAFELAKTTGFNISAQPIRLTPQPKLVKIVQMSRDAALRGEGSEDGAADVTA